jgi:hypothetical protein
MSLASTSSTCVRSCVSYIRLDGKQLTRHGRQVPIGSDALEQRTRGAIALAVVRPSSVASFIQVRASTDLDRGGARVVRAPTVRGDPKSITQFPISHVPPRYRPCTRDPFQVSSCSHTEVMIAHDVMFHARLSNKDNSRLMVRDEWGVCLKCRPQRFG